MNSDENFIICRMRQLLEERNWSIYRLAKESGMQYSSLNNIFVRNTIPSVLTLEKICAGFQITLSQFFEPDTPIIQTSDMLEADERALLEKYRLLKSTDKELLYTYLCGLSKTLPEYPNTDD